MAKSAWKTVSIDKDSMTNKQTKRNACFEYLMYSTWVKNFGPLLKASTATLLKWYVNFLGKYKW